MGALRALKWSLTATQDESQNSKHDILRAMAVRSHEPVETTAKDDADFRTKRTWSLRNPNNVLYFPSPVKVAIKRTECESNLSNSLLGHVMLM